MNARNLAGYVLLAFAAVSAVVMIVREERSGGGSTSHSIATTQDAERLIVYYFHSSQRCTECEQMEILSREAVEGGFAEAIKSGRMDYRTENWETPANQALRKELGVAFPSVVLVRMREGRIVEHKLLEDARPLLNDKEKFIGYVRMEIGAMLRRL